MAGRLCIESRFREKEVEEINERWENQEAEERRKKLTESKAECEIGY